MNEAKSSASQPYWEDFKCSIRYKEGEVSEETDDSEVMEKSLETGKKILWKNNLWVNNYCGNKLLSEIIDVKHPFVAD